MPLNRHLWNIGKNWNVYQFGFKQWKKISVKSIIPQNKNIWQACIRIHYYSFPYNYKHWFLFRELAEHTLHQHLWQICCKSTLWLNRTLQLWQGSLHKGAPVQGQSHVGSGVQWVYWSWGRLRMGQIGTGIGVGCYCHIHFLFLGLISQGNFNFHQWFCKCRPKLPHSNC